MILYLDTEFNGYRGCLLSMALVTDLDHDVHFYEVLPCIEELDPWVAEHVVLQKPPVGLNAFRKNLQAFLSHFDTVHVVADWPEDIQWFCWALITGPGERIDTPPLTMEIRRDLDTTKSNTPHNALADAYALHDAAFHAAQKG